MIYTVTFNPALDYVVKVNHFTLGMVNRTVQEDIYYGGKGINVSTVLKNLGYDNTALGFVAGFTGDEIVRGAKTLGFIPDFIRVEHTYTGVEVGYAGMLEAQCVDICQFKKRIGSHIPVYADVQEVHYEQLAGKSIVDNAWDTVMNAFADGLFLGGLSCEESIEIIKSVRKRLGSKIPIFLSSGATGDNISEILQYYDGVSVGTWVKNGNMRNPIDPVRAGQFMEGVKTARKLRENSRDEEKL